MSKRILIIQGYPDPPDPPDHLRADAPRNPHRGLADSACGTVNEQRLSCLQARDLQQHLLLDHAGDRQGGSSREREPVGLLDHEISRRDRPGGKGTEDLQRYA